MKDCRQICFGKYRLDTRDELLLHGSCEIPLRPKTYAFLQYLLKNPGRLVTKEELLSNLWPTCIVCDDALAHSVVEIRKALGDSARAPSFIETVHRRGYRFIGNIRGHRKSKNEPKSGRKRNHRKSDVISEHWVGREKELAQLQGHLDEALTGRRQVVFVTGEQGIGKTTLVNRFLSTLNRKFRFPSRQTDAGIEGSGRLSRIGIGRGQCLDFHGAIEAYMPVLEALTQLCQDSGRMSFFKATFRRHAPLWSMQMPTLASAAGSKTFHRTMPGIPRERMLREVAEALEAVSAEIPLILLLEDLHWSDYSTIDMISYLARRQARAQLMLIGTYRPSEAASKNNPLKAVKQDLQTHRLCKELPLTLLDEPAIGKYLMSRFLLHDLPVELSQWIHRRTEGNPLFMVNLVDDLLARGIIVCQDRHLALSIEMEKMSTEVPTTLHQMIEQQIDRHTEGEQRILEAGSIEGVEFSAAGVALGLKKEEGLIEAACEKLARQNQLLQSISTRQLANGKMTSSYRFIHTLYQNVCYRRLPEIRRVVMHQRIGEYLEQAVEADRGEGVAKLAMHFEQARDNYRAIRYYRQAADNANQRYAVHEAAELAKRGLRLLTMTPDAPEHMHQKLGLLIALGTALMWIQGFGGTEVKKVFTQARDLCKQCGESKQLVLSLIGLWLSCSVRSESEAAGQVMEQLLELGQNLQNPLLLSEIHHLAGMTLRNRGELTLALKHLEQGIVCRGPRKEDGFRLPDGKDPVIACLCFAALIKWRLGFSDQALEKAGQALALSQKTDHPEDSVFALAATARLHRALRNSKKALELIEAARAAAHQHGWVQLMVDGASVYGWALAKEGRINEGISQLHQAQVVQQEIGSSHMRADLLAALAEVLKDAGRIEEGLAAVEEALEAVETTGTHHLEAEILLLKGDLLARKSENEYLESENPSPIVCENLSIQAEACFRHAIEIAGQQKAKAIELRASMSLARLLQKQNRCTDALQQLKELYDWFSEGYDTLDLRDARALLRQLS